MRHMHIPGLKIDKTVTTGSTVHMLLGKILCPSLPPPPPSAYPSPQVAFKELL